MPTPTPGAPEPSSAVSGVLLDAERAVLPFPCRCGARWSGIRAAHCAAGCHRTFTLLSAFDRHRRDGRCVEPGDAGLVPHERPGHQAWGWPGDPDAPTRWKEARSRD